MAILLAFVFLAFCGSAFTEVSVDDCPPNVVRDEYLQVFNNSCFEFVLTDLKEYVDAESYCVDNGGHLASIGSEAENDFIYDQLDHKFYVYDDVWIGLNDRDEEQSFEWTDGSEVTYSHWDVPVHRLTGDFSDRSKMAADCVIFRAMNGFWFVEHCQPNIFNLFGLFSDHHKPFVCRYKLDVPEDEDTGDQGTGDQETGDQDTSGKGKGDDWHADVRAGIDQYTQKCQVVDCGGMDCGMSGFKTDENNCKKCECL